MQEQNILDRFEEIFGFIPNERVTIIENHLVHQVINTLKEKFKKLEGKVMEIKGRYEDDRSSSPSEEMMSDRKQLLSLVLEMDQAEKNLNIAKELAEKRGFGKEVS